MSFVEDRSVLTLESRAPDREIRYGEDPLHIADVWESRSAADGPLVVLIHGGFWRPAFDRRHLGPFANAIAETGFTVASIEYHRVPGSPDLTTGDVTYEVTDRGWISYFNDLHKGRNAGPAWSLFIDVFAVAALVFASTGLLLLKMHSNHRPATWPVVGLGLVLPLLIAMLLIH